MYSHADVLGLYVQAETQIKIIQCIHPGGENPDPDYHDILLLVSRSTGITRLMYSL